MSDLEQCLLAAVLASPGDDAPRLILADYWDENAQSDRAEFCRVQCRIAFLDMGDNQLPMGVGREELCGRERKLLKANFGRWTEGLPESLVTKECPYCIDAIPDWETNAIECRQCEGEGLVSDEGNVEFRRGFVATLSCTAADWLEHGPEIVSRHPVEEVRLARIYDRERQVFAPFAFIGFHSNDIDNCPVCNTAALRWARHEAAQRGLAPEGVARAWGVEVKT